MVIVALLQRYRGRTRKPYVHGRNVFLRAVNSISKPFHRPDDSGYGYPMKLMAGCLLAALLCLVAACGQNTEMLRVVVQDEEIVILRDEIMEVTRGRDGVLRDHVSVILAEGAAKRIKDATGRHVGGTMSL